MDGRKALDENGTGLKTRALKKKPILSSGKTGYLYDDDDEHANEQYSICNYSYS